MHPGRIPDVLVKAPAQSCLDPCPLAQGSSFTPTNSRRPPQPTTMISQTSSAAATSPPITPPAMAPTLDLPPLLLGGLGLEPGDGGGLGILPGGGDGRPPVCGFEGEGGPMLSTCLQGLFLGGGAGPDSRRRTAPNEFGMG